MSSSNDYPFDLLKQLRSDPRTALKQAQDEFSSFESSVHSRLYVLLAFAVGYAREIDKKPKMQREFISDTFFKGEKVLHKGRTLRLVMRYLLKAKHNTPMYGRACTYSRALEKVFKNGMPVERIPEHIAEAGGIENLFHEAKQGDVERGRNKNPSISALEERREGDPIGEGNRVASGTILDDSESTNDGEAESDKPRKTAATAAQGSVSPRLDPRTELRVSMPAEKLSQLFTDKPEHAVIGVSFKYGDEGEFVEARMTSWS